MTSMWISLLASAVIFSALAATIIFLFRPAPPAVQYRIVILLLFFAISAVSSLLFFTHERTLNMSGNVGFFTFAVGGPAALWLIALVVFTYFYPESTLEPVAQHTLPVLLHLIDKVESDSDWHNYAEWKGTTTEFSTILGSGESATVKNFLWYTYFQMPGPKLSNPVITTAFFYFKSFTLKLQRIQGTKNGDNFRLLFSSATSLSSSSSRSIAFIGRDRGAVKILASRSDYGVNAVREIELTEKRIDCLVFSYYDGDNPHEGDYVVVDLKRYSDNASGHIRLGIVDFEREMHSFHLSTLKRRNVALDIPLSFRSEAVLPSESLTLLEANLRPWLSALDDLLKSAESSAVSEGLFSEVVSTKNKLSENFKRIGLLKSGEDLSFCHLLNLSAQGKSRHFLDLPRAKEIVLTMFKY